MVLSMSARMLTLAASIFATALPFATNAQTPPPVSPESATDQESLDSFKWQEEGQAKLGARAELAIPSGFRFLPAAEASRFIEALGNISSRQELGLISSPDLEWFVVFFFDDIGYVKDDEKDELDAGKMAQQIKERLAESNQIRKDRGIPSLQFDGWAIEPRFNEDNKQLEWASRLRSEGGTSVNYNTRVLGRKGVMRVILVTGPEQLETTIPKYQALMSGFRYTDGERYSQYVSGDKIAEYGLMALVAGGATAVAAKTGLLTAILLFFKKGAKLILVGLAAIG
ncbi:MAG: DUF2167 domain-containing protein, partial [Myxococcota bacterium]